MPTARWVLTAVAGLDGTIYAIGGSDGRSALGTVEAYDTLSRTWTLRAPMPTPRHNVTGAVSVDGRVFVFGGSNGFAPIIAPLDTDEAYDPRTDTWVRAAPMPTARFGAVAVTG